MHAPAAAASAVALTDAVPPAACVCTPEQRKQKKHTAVKPSLNSDGKEVRQVVTKQNLFPTFSKTFMCSMSTYQ